MPATASTRWYRHPPCEHPHPRYPDLHHRHGTCLAGGIKQQEQSATRSLRRWDSCEDPTTPCRSSPVRISRIWLLPSSTFSLLLGTIGIPRQVSTGEPNRLTVAGGTPRRVASRPNAAIALGCARKNAGSFHTCVISSSRSSGVGGPASVLIRCCGGDVGEHPVIPVMEQLGLLALLDRLDREAELLPDLVDTGGCRDPRPACERRRPSSPS